MKISELAERSGLTVQTIKFYIRSGLLPRGTVTAATRAEYDGRHLERLRLIRALREVGDLPVAAVQKIVQALDEEAPLHDLLGTVQYALGPHPEPTEEDPDRQAARAAADALVTELGWRVSSRAPARDLLAETFAALARLGRPVDPAALAPYVEAARNLAEHEAGQVSADEPRDQAVLTMLVGTVFHERILTALHRLAQEDASARRFAPRS
ncbi:MerR family transcriptional regulator [Actinomadura craniellae]|uniref:MerR family transcriptional regulator n=1 Tax=Actinomadura craniellae TaxID=2231787 RepID=A0A365H032_9ACTN|nr:MerR family transcriptional regulator [Actinomadura craniellae]RAY12430.1 MerR family transcriptional regulator [Actinomadura craniellae]